MPFKPGQPPPHPGGLTTAEMRARRQLMGLSDRAMRRLEQLIESDNEQVALGACREVLARVIPVPKANVLAVTPASDAHLDALVKLALRGKEPEDTPVIDADPLPPRKPH